MPTIDTNLYVKASTQYTGITFNSYANFAGKRVAASSSGISNVCCGTDDNGTDIDAYFTPVLTDFGISNPKRIRYLYIGFESDGNLTVEVSVDETVARSYTITANKSGQQRLRLPIDRDGKGRYWSFKIKNVSGSNFAIDSIDILPIILSEGFI